MSINQKFWAGFVFCMAACVLVYSLWGLALDALIFELDHVRPTRIEIVTLCRDMHWQHGCEYIPYARDYVAK